MSIEKVRAYFKTLNIEDRIMEFDASSGSMYARRGMIENAVDRVYN